MSQIQKINLHRVEVKYADIDDSVASKVSWEPAKRGGANFKTQKMHHSSRQISIKKTTRSIIFALLFFLPGAVAVLVGFPVSLYNGELLASLFLLVWGAIFGGAGLFLLLSDRKPLIFDRNAGLYFFGSMNRRAQSFDRTQQGKLSDIYALQLISERIRSRSSRGGSHSYNSYELNLVFSDGDRLNIMDHGNLADIEDSAKKLGQFLDVPIWQATF